MMPLQAPVELTELKTDRFDFLVDVPSDTIVRMDELHASEQNDSEYVFLIWFRDEDAETEHAPTIARNLDAMDDGWRGRLDRNDTGLVIVRVWL